MMSTLFWKVIKLSPALLGASLLVASSAYAQENIPSQTAGVSAEVPAEPKSEPLAQKPEASVEVPAVSQLLASSNLLESVSAQTAPISAQSGVEAPAVSQPIASSNAPENVPAPAPTASLGDINPTVDPLAQLPQPAAPEISVSQLKPASETSPNANPIGSPLAQSIPSASGTTPNADNTQVLDQINRYNLLGVEFQQGQVTSVSQLSDVSPGDWAFEALRSLVERYGCIAGYPDGTYRGNRAMTRYEFAAGLNACLQQVERLIAASAEGFVRREDLETLQRLVEEFQSELANLGSRVDTLEGRVAVVEENQFSTTTKLAGEVIFAAAQVFGDEVAVRERAGVDAANAELLNDNTILVDRVRLNFETSFTGRDRLRTRLEAANARNFNTDTGTNMARLAFDDDTSNNVRVDELWYRFPLGSKIIAQVDAANGEFQDTVVDTVNPLFASSATGSISRFGRFSPIYRLSGKGAGGAITFNPTGVLSLSAAYYASEGQSPLEDQGVINGSYAALGQVTFRPTDFLTIAGTYVHAYYRGNSGIATASNNVFVTGSTGSVNANTPFTGAVATESDSFGVQANLKFGKLQIGGWAAYQIAEALDSSGNPLLATGVVQGDEAKIWNWAVNLGIQDFGKRGSLLGFVFGMPPRAGENDVEDRRDRDTGYHIEGFYRYRLNDNISIAPGVIVLLNPEHNEDNEDIFVGVVRTTFTF